MRQVDGGRSGSREGMLRMTQDLKQRVKNFMIEHRMISKGDIVCAGVSGGADSVCLLLLLRDLQNELGFCLKAFHVDHGLRGKDSDGDRLFVEHLCKRLEIPFHAYFYDIAGIARESRRGIEETGRLMRQQAAADYRKITGGSKTALAHHADDNAETVLFHLARGASLGGLKGMLPVNGPVIRPLLSVTRKEIETWLKQRGQAWRIDASNGNCDFSRNRIRNVILPELTEHINDQAVRHINNAAEDAAGAEEVVHAVALKLLRRYSRRENDQIFLRNEIRTKNRLVNCAVAMEAMRVLSGSAADFSRNHAERVAGLFDMQVGKQVDLAHGLSAERAYGGVVLARKMREDATGTLSRLPEIPLVPGNKLRVGGMTFLAERIAREDVPAKIPENRYTKWFDYDKIGGKSSFRFGRSGDYLIINQEGGRKKLSDYLIDCKVPRKERGRMICLAAGNEIFWVVGLRIGESAKVTDTTKRVIRITARENRGQDEKTR